MLAGLSPALLCPLFLATAPTSLTHGSRLTSETCPMCKKLMRSRWPRVYVFQSRTLVMTTRVVQADVILYHYGFV
jgi:hypothetical protein